MKKIITLALAIILIVVSTGCAAKTTENSQESAAPSGKTEDTKIEYVEVEKKESDDVIVSSDGYIHKEGSSIVIHEATGREVDLNNLNVACVHKSQGSFWMDSTNTEGMNWAAAQNGKATWNYFPAQTFDAASQMAALNDAMATDPDVLIVCPTAGEAVNEAITTVKEKGTLVIAVEGQDYMDNVDYFLDPFEENVFIKMHVDEIVKRLGDDITYCLWVGKLTTPFQVLWCDIFYDYATKTYPNMKCIIKRGEYLEHNDSEEGGYETAKQVLLANEDIDLLWSASAGGTLGIARAINELGLTGKVYACGHARPSGSKFAIDNGSALFTTIHYPGAWGWAAAELGRKIWAGEPIENKADLDIEGYNSITVIGKHVYGEGWYLQDKDTIDSIVAKYPEF